MNISPNALWKPVVTMLIPPKKKRKTKPKSIWGAILSSPDGLKYTRPIKFDWCADIGAYLDEEESDYEIKFEEIGLLIYKADGSCWILFSSTSKEEVAIWIKGARSAMTILNTWCHSSYNGFKNLE